MNTEKLEAFLVAAETGNLTEASHHLGYTQSGMLYVLNTLEAEIGYPLLERGHFGVRLTPRGEALRPYIADVVEKEKALENKMHALSDTGYEILKIGSFSSMTIQWLPAIVEKYSRDFPGVRLEIESASTEDLARGLEKAKYDLVFTSDCSRGKSDWIPLQEDQLVAILPPDYETPWTDQFPVSEYDGRPFLMPGMGFNLEAMRIFSRNGVQPDIISTSLDDPFIISMVEHGIGISMLSQLITSGHPSTVRQLPLYPPASRMLGIAVDPTRHHLPHVESFIRYAKQVIKDKREAK